MLGILSADRNELSSRSGHVSLVGCVLGLLVAVDKSHGLLFFFFFIKMTTEVLNPIYKACLEIWPTSKIYYGDLRQLS